MRDSARVPDWLRETVAPDDQRLSVIGAYRTSA